MLNSEIIEKYGFKRVNNSMFRKGNITLQHGYSNTGTDLYDIIINEIKGFNVCVNGSFKTFISNEKELKELLEN